MSIDYSKYEGHTEGPWEVIVQDGSIMDQSRVCPPSELVGVIGSPIVCDGKEVRFYVAQNVDAGPTANLIADAPELLKRCRKLEEAIEQIQLSTFTGSLEAVEDSMRAAVRLMRGPTE